MAQELNYVRQVLSDAVSRRGRYYAHFHNCVVRFTDDDSRADEDSLNFQDILKMLGLPRAKEVLLGRQTMWDWASAMKTLYDALDTQDERKLIIFHYAGHAVLIGGDLHLVASLGSKRTMDFELSFGQLYRNSVEFTNADVIIVLDCCFSGAATRAMGQEERSVEIIAAVGSSQEAFGNVSNQVRLQQKTFTSRLADEVARVVGNPAKSSVAFAEIISSMRAVSNPDRLPEYRLRRGTIGIRLEIPEKSRSALQKYIPPKERQFGHSQSSSTGSAPPPPGLMAVFKIHIDTSDSKSPEIGKLVEWIHKLHPSIGLELNGVFEGRSMEIFVLAPWSTWALLRGLRGFELLCETRSGNRQQAILSQMAAASLPQGQSHPQE